MIRIITTFLVLGASTLCFAEDRLPQPHYQRQPSDPEWLAQAVQFHGHLGPSAIAGARMGMIGLRTVEAKGYFDVEVTCEGPMAKPPQSCFLDGLQVGTGATTGKRSLNWVQADRIVVKVKNTRTGKTAEIRPAPALMQLLGAFKPQAKAGGQPRVTEKYGPNKVIVPEDETEVAAICFVVEGSEAAILRVDLADAEQVQAEDFEGIRSQDTAELDAASSKVQPGDAALVL